MQEQKAYTDAHVAHLTVEVLRRMAPPGSERGYQPTQFAYPRLEGN